MTEKLRNIEAAWSDVFLKKKKNVYVVKGTEFSYALQKIFLIAY